MRKLVMFLDYTGLPRAWGLHEDVAVAERVALDNLERYCEKQKHYGEINLADPTRYTKKVEACK